MHINRFAGCLVLSLGITACSNSSDDRIEISPPGSGPYTVASTNLQVASTFEGIGDEAMHDYLLGRPDESGMPRFIADILEYPESVFITPVEVPDEPTLYGPASGRSLPLVTYIVYPSGPATRGQSYAFPYQGARYGAFDNMLGPDEKPVLAGKDERYPLVILAHGSQAHGLYEVRRAQTLASHGYIVAAITYGDDRTAIAGDLNIHLSYLRPLLTAAVLDDLLESAEFGEHIDTANIGISGHSFGGTTALTVAGGPFLGNSDTVRDPRITAASIAAPWVGGHYDGNDVHAFGDNNEGLHRVEIPVISFFASNDELTPSAFILPAMQKLSGPLYVVELLDQPHIFEAGSWQDRDTWELLFFSAYLKHDRAALESLGAAESASGGKEDLQRVEFQKR